MSYSLIKSDGTLLTTIADGDLDTSSSNLRFPGPNYVGYGQSLNENLLYLLENFAGNTAPNAGPNLIGQLWYNKSTQTLNVFTPQGYKPVAGVKNQNTEPVASESKDGDIWFNTLSNQTYIYNNGSFNLVGPQYTKAQGVSGAIPDVVQDGFATGVTHNIVKLQFGGVTYAIVSSDASFTPATPITGFARINPGITLSSSILSPTLNSNLVGSVTGNVAGNLTGNVIATTLTGTLTGNVVGNLTGDVTGTTLRGSLIGNFSGPTGYAANFSSGNAVITGGSATGLTHIAGALAEINNIYSTMVGFTNLSTGNALITGGSITGLSNFSTIDLQSTNFSTGNALITGGSITGVVALDTTIATATNFSSPNVLVSGGSVTGLATLTAGTTQSTNFSTGNAVITGGSATGLTALSAGAVTATTLSATSATFTSGNISNLTGTDVVLTSANLITAVATTKSYSDNTTAVATTAFVQSVLPQGVIVMWGGSVLLIPTGWQICDGSNGTPDLRNQFIIGAGDTSVPGYIAPGTTGGATAGLVTLTANNMPAHIHTITVNGNTTGNGSHTHSATSTSTSTSSLTDPGHNHVIGIQGGNGSVNAANSLVGAPSQDTGRKTGTSATGITVDTTTSTSTTVATASSHTHTLAFTGNTGSAGAGQAVDIRPPYYALCYIQKMY